MNNEQLNEIFEEAERDGKLVAVVKQPYKKSEAVAIDKGYKEIQKLVGGTFDVADLPDFDDIHGFCNDEGLLIGLEPNFYRPEWKDAIVGLAVFLGASDNGESISLSREQVKKVTEYLETNRVNDFGEFYMNIQTDFAHYKPKKQAAM